MISEAALDAIRARCPVAEVAERLGARLRRSGRALIGSCPICSTHDTKAATRFEIKDGGEHWVCAVCEDGGDVIRLVERVQGCDFRAAVEFLGGAQEIDAGVAARRQAERDERRRVQSEVSAAYRESERVRLKRMWDAAGRAAGSPVETYLGGRGLRLPRHNKHLRFVAEAAYYHGREIDARGKERPRCIHVGPAMLAAIIRHDGVFGGLHFTYLAHDAARKATIADPDTGEILPAKKVRGTKSGGAIPLINPPGAKRLFWGEGIETVLSVALAAFEMGDALATPGPQAFWSAVDLHNLGGKAAGAAAHPSEKLPSGKAARVPGPEPDLDSPAAPIPDSVDELIILADADCDDFLVRCAAKRCAARYARPGRVVLLARARSGADFNDMWRERQA